MKTPWDLKSIPKDFHRGTQPCLNWCECGYLCPGVQTCEADLEYTEPLPERWRKRSTLRGAENVTDAGPRVFHGESWCPASQPPLSFSSICSEGGSLRLFAKSVSGARFWRWMEASLQSPVVRQEDLLDAGDQSSVADDRFTGFLVPWEWVDFDVCCFRW